MGCKPSKKRGANEPRPASNKDKMQASATPSQGSQSSSLGSDSTDPSLSGYDAGSDVKSPRQGGIMSPREVQPELGEDSNTESPPQEKKENTTRPMSDELRRAAFNGSCNTDAKPLSRATEPVHSSPQLGRANKPKSGNADVKAGRDPRRAFVERGRSRSDITETLISMRRLDDTDHTDSLIVFDDSGQNAIDAGDDQDNKSEASAGSRVSGSRGVADDGNCAEARSRTSSAASNGSSRFADASLRSKRGLPKLNIDRNTKSVTKAAPAGKGGKKGIVNGRGVGRPLRKVRSLQDVMGRDSRLPRKKPLFKAVQILPAVSEDGSDGADAVLAMQHADLNDILSPRTKEAMLTDSPNLQWHHGKLKPKHLLSASKTDPGSSRQAKDAELRARVARRKAERAGSAEKPAPPVL